MRAFHPVLQISRFNVHETFQIQSSNFPILDIHCVRQHYGLFLCQDTGGVSGAIKLLTNFYYLIET